MKTNMAASMKKSMSNKKRKLEDLSVDEFMRGGFDSDSDSDNEQEKDKVVKAKKLKNSKDIKKKKQKEEKVSKKKERLKESKKSQKILADTKEADGKTKKSSHKQSLESLKEKDPEFYEFLQQEDQDLLAFEDSDDDELDESEEDEEDGNEDDEEGIDDIPSSSDEDEIHRPPEKLEEASDVSDSSDEEDDEEEGSKVNKVKGQKKVKGELVTLKMIKEWSESVQKSPTLNTIKDMINAFKAAVKKAGSEMESSKFRVEGNAVYNAVIRMCLSLMATATQKYVGLPPLTDLQKPTLPAKNNVKWKKIRHDMKAYLTAILELLAEIKETSMVNVIVKHIFKLIGFYVMFPKLAKILMKKMILLWSTAEETSRVIAFLCINRQVTITQESMLEPCIKQMYIAYVKNCKFTSPTTLPMINFMQHSLVEIFTIDAVLGYQYAFIYIRQLAIHLRNAIMVKKKENIQAVYNWQYIHCMELWVRLLSATYPSDIFQPLIYPLTQTILGTVKLTPTARYFPLRFHCVRMMNSLSEATDTFIPILPLLLEIKWASNTEGDRYASMCMKVLVFIPRHTKVFELVDFNKKHKNISFKPFNFACILKLSKAQLLEKSFKDGIIDQLYELFMDHFNVHSHKIGFPELILPAVIQLKDFLKKCKVANYCKQMKQIMDKVIETGKFITERRKSVSFSISDDKAITAWEIQCKNAGTPLSKYYTTWRKLRDRELQYQIAAKEQGMSKAEESIPTIERPKVLPKATTKEKEELSALFEDDSDESDDEMRFLPKKEKSAKKKDSDSEGDYSDFDSDELEQLAKSASEDEEESGDEMSDDESNEMSDDEESGENEFSDEDDDQDEEEDDDVDEKDDIVEDFSMSDSD